MEIRLFKKADKARNKIIIPKWFVEKYGTEYYMIIKDNKITLEPTKTI